MVPDNQRCPKCNGEMTQGFIVDRGNAEISLRSREMGFGTRHVSKWAPGTPVKSLLLMTKVRNALPIGTFRCSSCGYLESYASPEFASETPRQFSLRALFIAITLIAVVLGILVTVIRLAN